MPATLTSNSQGRLFISKSCETCGNPHAPFGYGVNLATALKRHEMGDKEGYAKRLGKWYCGICKPRD